MISFGSKTICKNICHKHICMSEAHGKPKRLYDPKKKVSLKVCSSLKLLAHVSSRTICKLGKRFGKAAAQFHVAAQLGMESLSMAVLSVSTKWKRLFVFTRICYFFLKSLVYVGKVKNYVGDNSNYQKTIQTKLHGMHGKLVGNSFAVCQICSG